MVYNTKNGASLQKLPDKSEISGKRQWILLLEIVKKESKTLNTFQKLLEQISQSPQYNRSRGLDRLLDLGNVYQSVPQTRLGSYFQNRKIFPFRKESILPFRKNHPLSKGKKIELSLCMSLVFCALRNVSFNNNNHILKFVTESFENLPSSFFFNSENNLSSIEQCTWVHFLLPVWEVSFRHSQQDG